MSAAAGARAWDLLRQQARRTGSDVQALATSYAIERFMARLMAADGEARITVKGGQSLGILFGNQMRPTKDLDINVGDEGIDDPENWARRAVSAACAAGGHDDGLAIDPDGVSFERREHQGEGGLRITVPAAIHTCRANFMIDVGIGNEITFEPTRVAVPGVLGGHKSAPPALNVRIYPHENTLAEKIVAKIEDGIASIRHKDFFDIWLSTEIMRRAGDLRLLVAKDAEMTDGERVLARQIKSSLADGTLLDMPEREISAECMARLGLALARTSAHRQALLPEDLHAWLVDEFASDALHSAQWANWCRNQKGRLLYQPPGTGKDQPKEEALRTLFADIGPVLAEIGRLSSDAAPAGPSA